MHLFINIQGNIHFEQIYKSFKIGGSSFISAEGTKSQARQSDDDVS